jgi:hypothetical protein
MWKSHKPLCLQTQERNKKELGDSTGAAEDQGKGMDEVE